MFGSLKAKRRKKKKEKQHISKVSNIYISQWDHTISPVQGFGSQNTSMLTYRSVFSVLIKTEYYADMMDNNDRRLLL